MTVLRTQGKRDKKNRSSADCGKTLKHLSVAPPGEPTFRESIEELIDGHDEGALPGEVEERTMFRNLLDFGRLDVADVMVPRADILSVQESVTLNDLIALICEHGHSRVPVHRGSLDDVIGMVHIRDVLAFWGRSDEFQLFSVVRSLLFVPPFHAHSRATSRNESDENSYGTCCR